MFINFDVHLISEIRAILFIWIGVIAIQIGIYNRYNIIGIEVQSKNEEKTDFAQIFWTMRNKIESIRFRIGIRQLFLLAYCCAGIVLFCANVAHYFVNANCSFYNKINYV